jgi:hypothetical protein
MKLHPLLATVVLVGTAIASHAAIITWGAATNISGDSDVITAGTLLGAFSLGDTGIADTTVNGVPFEALLLTGSSVTSGNFRLAVDGPALFYASNTLGSGSAPFTTLSPSYQALLSSGGGRFRVPIFLTMSGLSVNTIYQFQWWSNRSHDFFNTGAQNRTTASAPGNNVTLNANPSLTEGALGQYGLGTFIADSTSQVIAFSAADNSTINGFQLRLIGAVGVPDSGTTLGLLALSLGVLAIPRLAARKTRR